MRAAQGGGGIGSGLGPVAGDPYGHGQGNGYGYGQHPGGFGTQQMLPDPYGNPNGSGSGGIIAQQSFSFSIDHATLAPVLALAVNLTTPGWTLGRSPAAATGADESDPRLVWSLVELLAQLHPEHSLQALQPSYRAATSAKLLKKYYSTETDNHNNNNNNSGTRHPNPGMMEPPELDSIDKAMLVVMELDIESLDTLHNICLSNPDVRRLLSARRPLELLNGLAWTEEPEIYVPASETLHSVLTSAIDGIADGTLSSTYPPPPPQLPSTETTEATAEDGSSVSGDVAEDAASSSTATLSPEQGRDQAMSRIHASWRPLTEDNGQGSGQGAGKGILSGMYYLVGLGLGLGLGSGFRIRYGFGLA